MCGWGGHILSWCFVCVGKAHSKHMLSVFVCVGENKRIIFCVLSKWGGGHVLCAFCVCVERHSLSEFCVCGSEHSVDVLHVGGAHSLCVLYVWEKRRCFVCANSLCVLRVGSSFFRCFVWVGEASVFCTFAHSLGLVCVWGAHSLDVLCVGEAHSLGVGCVCVKRNHILSTFLCKCGKSKFSPVSVCVWKGGSTFSPVFGVGNHTLWVFLP